MKIVFLKTWKGELFESLRTFIRAQIADGVDVFCFQEAEEKMFDSYKELLPGYQHTYVPKNSVDKPWIFAQLTSWSDRYFLDSVEPISLDFVAGGLSLHTQFARPGENDISICNVHGVARPGSKKDTDVRIKQTYDILEFYQHNSGPKIIGGDFNILPDTDSIRAFEKNGYRDLIKEYGIKTTRNRLVWDLYPNQDPLYFSDYVFVSPEVKVKSFTVPNIEISDHLPMILEIE